jgi:hypothetical protein
MGRLVMAQPIKAAADPTEIKLLVFPTLLSTRTYPKFFHE